MSCRIKSGGTRGEYAVFRRQSQRQSARNNAQQLQVNIDARQVVGEQIRETAQQFGAQGAIVANDRMAAFGEKLLLLLASEGLLPAFGEPAFQNSSRAAFTAASAVADVATHDRLARLLVRRATVSNQSSVLSTAIDALVPIVGRVHPNALRGLAGAWAFLARTAGAPTILGGLRQLEDLYAAFEPSTLPFGDVWLGHLESLGLIRFVPFAHSGERVWLKLFLDSHPGYNTGGITQEHFDAMVEILLSKTNVKYMEALPHDFAPSLVRTSFATEWLLRQGLGLANAAAKPEYEKVHEVLYANQLWAMPSTTVYNGIEAAMQDLPHVLTFSQWWDQVPSFAFTQIGTVLANAEYARLRPSDEWEELELDL